MGNFKEKLMLYTLGGMVIFNTFFFVAYRASKNENKELTQKIVRISTDQQESEKLVQNLQTINREGIQLIYNKIENMERRLPGIGNMFGSAKFFLDKTKTFNDAPEETDESAEIIKAAQLFPGNLDELQREYMYDLHGIQNYKFAYPFFKIPFEDDAMVYVSSDRGTRKNILVEQGIEKYIGSSFHDGYDLVSTNKKIIAQYDYKVVLYKDFHNLPEGDSHRDLYGGGGRVAILRREAIYNETSYGYYHELFAHLSEDSNIPYTPGDIIHAGETIGIMGNSGLLSTGEHLHWACYYIDEDTGKPIPVDQFANKTWGVKGAPENVLYFFESPYWEK